MLKIVWFDVEGWIKILNDICSTLKILDQWLIIFENDQDSTKVQKENINQRWKDSLPISNVKTIGIYFSSHEQLRIISQTWNVVMPVVEFHGDSSDLG